MPSFALSDVRRSAGIVDVVAEGRHGLTVERAVEVVLGEQVTDVRVDRRRFHSVTPLRPHRADVLTERLPHRPQRPHDLVVAVLETLDAPRLRFDRLRDRSVDTVVDVLVELRRVVDRRRRLLRPVPSLLDTRRPARLPDRERPSNQRHDDRGDVREPVLHFHWCTSRSRAMSATRNAGRTAIARIAHATPDRPMSPPVQPAMNTAVEYSTSRPSMRHLPQNSTRHSFAGNATPTRHTSAVTASVRPNDCAYCSPNDCRNAGMPPRYPNTPNPTQNTSNRGSPTRSSHRTRSSVVSTPFGPQMDAARSRLMNVRTVRPPSGRVRLRASGRRCPGRTGHHRARSRPSRRLQARTRRRASSAAG